jgi:deferrochelatase/peroxidase EfeB
MKVLSLNSTHSLSLSAFIAEHQNTILRAKNLKNHQTFFTFTSVFPEFPLSLVSKWLTRLPNSIPSLGTNTTRPPLHIYHIFGEF